jgi:hypothetical protein
MVLGALIQHWLCYQRYPESRCISLFHSPSQKLTAPPEPVLTTEPGQPVGETPQRKLPT